MSSNDCHLVVLCHGLWGLAEHFDYLEKALAEKAAVKAAAKAASGSDEKKPATDVVFYKTRSNERYRTYDGVDLCGARVAEEILEETARIKADQGRNVVRFSIIGYSLGGLVSRYAIGLLDYHGYFDNREPIDFVTMCSPNVGVLTPGESFSVKLFNWIVPNLLGNSGRQMFLKDDVFQGSKAASHRKVPLLTMLADPKSIFYRALAKFNRRILYSNVRSDIRTSWWTSGISYVNPFEILDADPSVKIDKDGVMQFGGSKLELQFLDGYEPVILDADKPLVFSGSKESASAYGSGSGSGSGSGGQINQMIGEDMPADNDSTSTAARETQNFVLRHFKWVVMLFRVCVYLPMWITWFILNNFFQCLSSAVRAFRESSKVKDYIDTSYLVDPLPSKTMASFENDLHDQGDYFLDSVFDAVADPLPEDKQYQGIRWGTTLNKLCSTPPDASSPFYLALSGPQMDIVRRLNRLQWSKYPLYITGTNATHAAAIMRHPDPAFEQGKVSVRHLCDTLDI